jgi:hypothetical protein
MRPARFTAILGGVSRAAALYPRPLRFASRRLDDVPAIAAAAVAIVAVIDLVSAVTRKVMWRGHLLVYVEPVGVMRAAHALAVPVSLALLITAYYLFRRRSRAFQLASCCCRPSRRSTSSRASTWKKHS